GRPAGRRQRMGMPADAGQRLGMDGQRLRSLSGVRARRVPRLLGALVPHAQGPARRGLDDAGPPAAQHLAELLHAGSPRRLGRLPDLRARMKICMVTPAPPRSLTGNRVTALRWARLLGQLGHRVTVVEEYDGQACDLMVALHARKSASSIERLAEEKPGTPIVLALTGTDLYRGGRPWPTTQTRQPLENRRI